MKCLFTAASLLLPVQLDLSRQAMASVGSSMSLWTRKAFWEGCAWPTGVGQYHWCDLWCSTAPAWSLWKEGTFPTPILYCDLCGWLWSDLKVRAILREECYHSPVLCSSRSLPQCGPEWLWSKGLCWWVDAARAGTVCELFLLCSSSCLGHPPTTTGLRQRVRTCCKVAAVRSLIKQLFCNG